ncbi:MAG: TonB-dependent siderophore receptor [Phormidesmis sp.]
MYGREQQYGVWFRVVRWCLSGRWSPLLMLTAGLLGASGFAGLRVQAAQTREGVEALAEEEVVASVRSRELDEAATSVEDWLAQIEAALTEVTGFRVEDTDTGLQVVLEADGEITASEPRSAGNALIVEIANASLNLPEAVAAEQFEPAEGIALVQVSALAGDRVQVVVTGTDAVPEVAVSADATGLTLSVAPGVAQVVENEDAIQLVVTGEEDEGYNPSSSSTATRTNTPLRDLPASVQVIPQEVIRDQGVTELREAIRNNAPGVQFSTNYGGFGGGNIIIRGFEQAGGAGAGVTFRDGFRNFDQFAITDLANIERIDVLRGPASVLFGQVQPGGIVNIVTEQPLSEPTYTVETTAGQFSFYRSDIDFSGPLTEDGDVLYRLNAAYQNSGSFRDQVNEERFFIAPVFQWDISENTSLDFDFSYLYNDPVYDDGLKPLNDGSLVLPIERYLGYPSLDGTYTEQWRAGYRLNHQFSDDWRLRNAFTFSSDLLVTDRSTFSSRDLIDDRFVELIFRGDESYLRENYQLQADLIGTFSTGSVDHELTVGLELYRYDVNGFERDSSDIPLLDAFNPDYDVERPELGPSFQYGYLLSSLGIYIQDQMDITDNLILSLGGRRSFDELEDSGFFGSGTTQSDSAFSPNLCIVYQPIEPISLYASFAQSFNPSIGRSQDGSSFEPERGTQYEIGIKTDISENLSASLAAFDLTRSNVLTTDPDDPDFSIQTGEQRSQGIELLLTGEILPGWNIYAGYAYTDAKVTEDNRIPVGDSLRRVAEHTANLWTTYEIQGGDLQGLGLGLGLLFVGEREGDLPNSDFELPSYFRTDASIFYRKENWRAGININNLFDTEYYESGSSFGVYPGSPFNAQATLSYTF